jgi:hypothetical protein
MKRNPVEALAIINPEDGVFTRAMYGVMHRAEDAVEYAKEEPLKAFLYSAAFAAAGYGFYRMLRPRDERAAIPIQQWRPPVDGSHGHR